MAENEAKVPQDKRGEMKETIGQVIGDEDLERQGRADQAKSDLREAGEQAKEGLSDAADQAKAAAESAGQKVKDAFNN
ncbi:MAG: CsbD family protein [Jiangellales bacterium]